jgi:hypothetical protein
MRDCEQSERCEHCEILVSAWHDGELDRGGQVEMLDHLVRCAGCRDFYFAARGLAGLVIAVRAPATAEEPSPEVWRRIEQSTTSREPVPARGGARPWMRRFPVRAWAAAAAAAVLLIIFGPPLVRDRTPTDSRTTAGAEIRLGGNPAGMDDARFIELARTVLGADRKYREAFYEVMKQVVRDTQGSEPSMDGLLPPGEGRESAEPPENVRGPS